MPAASFPEYARKITGLIMDNLLNREEEPEDATWLRLPFCSGW